jgi:hypothetical protein
MVLRLISDFEPTGAWLVLTFPGWPGIAFTDHGLEPLGASQPFFDGFADFHSHQNGYDQDLSPPQIL